MQEAFTFIVSLLLIMFVVIDLAVAYLLTKSKRASRGIYPALNERTLIAQTSLLSGVLLATLGVNRIMELGFTSPMVLVILSIALVIKSTPSIIWLFYLTRGKFRPTEPKATLEE